MIESWYIPCNIRFCNVIDIIKHQGEIVWRRGASIHKGDIAYIYIGAPISEIRYKCIVTEEDVPKQVLQENLYARRSDDGPKQKYMKLKVLCEYQPGRLPLKVLKENGLTQVQRQARNSRELRCFLDSI
jgi:hypothetical protein